MFRFEVKEQYRLTDTQMRQVKHDHEERCVAIQFLILLGTCYRSCIHDRFHKEGGVRTAKVYREVEVVHAAWDFHGGPIGLWQRRVLVPFHFSHMLPFSIAYSFFQRLRADYLAHTDAGMPLDTFPIPHDYRQGKLYDVAREHPPELVDRYVNHSPVMQRVKEILPQWFWKACNEELNRVLLGGQLPESIDGVREHAMRVAVRFYKARRVRYVDRPEEPYDAPSIYVAMLRSLLGNIPRVPLRGSAQWGSDVPKLTFDANPEEHYEWDDALLERLFSCLCSIIAERGSGAKGWRGVRWLMYEQARISC